MKYAIGCLLVLAVVIPATAAVEDPATFTTAVAPAPSGGPNPWFVGGTFGAGGGDITWIEFVPWVGYRISPKWSAGLGVIFRYRKDKRFEPEVSTTDYGVNVFGRYFPAQFVFVQAEYERLSYEFLDFGGGTSRRGYDSVYLGVGYNQPLGERAAFIVAVLYNLLYDANEPIRPYDSPWVIRVGVSGRF